ncbi:MAG: YeeE/YedE family protein [Burkholderiaceae bacterium]|nr:YeeE/YedE family protein [Burkholderiaceae bacterium]MDO7671252.1 YeeE/YedE family protein [Burkholderiaceae bacterium]MDP4696370.1 YeeE/YedE family protein [Burkholderiaceae bacterium]MDP4842524.1 YeeE/YedE family protein [Burkholderiaceae bacterium]MDP4967059.1 YeeE/YedE family protein [Burkholderiaceae bacterium]
MQAPSFEEVGLLNTQILWACFGLTTLLGWVMQRTHFCTMGAVSDIVNMGDWTRMRVWVMAIAVAMIGFQSMSEIGLIDPLASIYASGRVLWLSAVVGGVLFGVGMVLASGCSSKTLLRIGSGSLKSVVVFAVMGLFAFMTLRGVFAVLRIQTLDRVFFELPVASLPQLLPGLLGITSDYFALSFAAVIGIALLIWCFAGPAFRQSGAAWGGLGIGLCVVCMWFLSGTIGFVQEHPQTLEAAYLATNSGRMEALSFTAPMAYTINWLIYFSDASNVLTIGVVSVLGLIFGGFLEAWRSKTFRWEGFANTRDTALHLIGAALMGVGGVTALGCTFGQGISGLSTLSVSSMIAFPAIIAGSLVGFKLQMWVLMRD